MIEHDAKIPAVAAALNECAEVRGFTPIAKHAVNHLAWAAIQAMAMPSEWQPIETAPKDGTVVLVCGFGHDGYYVADAKWDDGWWMFDPLTDGYDLESSKHTHWMPLPAPPAQSDIGRHLSKSGQF